MSEEIRRENYYELNEIIDLIARRRAEELILPAEERLKLDDLLDHISDNGDVPESLGIAPIETIKDDVVMYVKGKTTKASFLESVPAYIVPAYIQWGNQTNLKCKHLGVLGVNFTILDNSEVVFNHEMRRNLSESEIRDLSNVLKRTSWLSVEYKSMTEIEAEEKANDHSSEY